MATTLETFVKIKAETTGKENLESLSKTMNDLIGLAPKFAVFGTIGALIKKSFDNTLMVEGIRAVKAEFRVLAENSGLNSEKLSERIKATTESYLGFGSAIKVSNDAILKLGVSSEQLPELFKVARKAGLVLGRDTTEVMEELTQAVATGNQKLLKRIGLTFDAEKANKDFAKTIGVGSNELSNQGQIQARLNAILEVGKQKLAGIKEETRPVAEAFHEAELSSKKFFYALAESGQEARSKFFVGFAEKIKSSFDEGRVIFKHYVSDVKDSQSETEFLQLKVKNLSEEYKTLNERIANGSLGAIASQGSKRLEDDLSKATNALKQFEENQYAADLKKYQRQTTAAARNPENVKKDNAQFIDKSKTDEAAAKLKLKLVDATEDHIRKIKLESESLGKSTEEKRRLNDLVELENRGVKAGTKLYGELAEKLGEARDEQEKMEADFRANPFNGAKAALEDYGKSVADFSKLTENAVSKSLGSLEDTFVDFFTTGEFQWKKFANVVIQEIVRIAVKKAIIAPLAEGITSLFGFADGGVMTKEGAVPLRKYAKGGIANNPQMALFGEGSKPEAFVPLPDGRSIPVSVKGGGGAGNVSIVVNVSPSGEPSVEGTNAPNQKEMGKLIALAVQKEIVKQQRNGGLLAS